MPCSPSDTAPPPFGCSPDAYKLFVGNVPRSAAEADLLPLFAPLGAVVDSDLRVLGVDNLMVADASVFPTQISNNTNHTCYMIGELAARKLGAAAR